MIDKEISAKVAKYLLEVKAVKLSPDNPFTWTSGLLSPIYCDNRVTLSYPHVRTYIRDMFVGSIRKHFPDVECIAGIATAGIAQGVLIADVMGLPYVYIRPEPKKHGMKNSVEGYLKEGSKVVLVEDLVSTGKSSLAALDNLRNSGGDALGLVSIFTYGFPDALERFKKADCPYVYLSNYEVLLEEAEKLGYISVQDKKALTLWSADPITWANSHKQ